MVNPVKLLHVLDNVNFQEFDSADEDFLSYQGALGLVALDSNVTGAMTLSASGNLLIGSHNDTFYNEPVGTHPAASISSGSTITNLYQKMSLRQNEATADFHLPTRWEDSDSSIYETDSDNFDILCDRMLNYVLVNEWPGCYRLDSASPGADWGLFINDVFSDTRTDGYDKPYHIWRRNSLSAPPADERSLKIKWTGDSAGGPGAFEGVQEHTLAELRTTFGYRMSNRIGQTGVGEYQLRTSAQGAPSDPGTWTARGVAYDTKNTTEEVNYPAGENFVADYQTSYDKNPATGYTVEYLQTYVSDFILQEYSEPYTQTYTTFINYTFPRSYLTDYIQDTYTSVQLDRETYIINPDYVGDVTYLGAVNYAGPFDYQRLLSFGGSVGFVKAVGFVGTLNYVGVGNYVFQGTFVGWTPGGLQPFDGQANYTGPWTYSRDVSYTGNVTYTGTVQYTRFTLYTGESNYTSDQPFAGPVSYTGQIDYIGPGLVVYAPGGVSPETAYATFTGPTVTFTADYAGFIAYTTTLSYDIDYVRTYTGVEFIGTTIVNTTQTIETYTLYCRVSA